MGTKRGTKRPAPEEPAFVQDPERIRGSNTQFEANQIVPVFTVVVGDRVVAGLRRKVGNPQVIAGDLRVEAPFRLDTLLHFIRNAYSLE